MTTDRWLREFARRVRASASFLREMSAQLAPSFAARTGLALAEFVLAPEGPQMFVVESNGLVRFVRASIVGSRLGYAVTIAWADPAGRNAVEPTAQVGASDVRFWWHELPGDEIRRDEAKVPVPPFDVSRFSFPVRIAVAVWPHVQIAIDLRRDVTDDDVARIGDRFIAVQARWNESARGGTIPLVGDVERRDPRRVSFAVDLGSAGPAALEALLEALEGDADLDRVEVATG